MLIILSGSETIHKQFFAKNIIAALNTFVVDGFRVDFTKNPFEVFDSSDNLVWKPNTDITHILNNEDGSLNHEMSATLDKIIALENTILSTTKNNHFSDIFSNPLIDYGLVSGDYMFSPGRPDAGYSQSHSYQSILDNYNSRTFDNFVISGIFSKTFIEKIKLALGAENILVLNIVRNPAVCFLLNEKDDQFYIDKAPWNTTLDAMKLQNSLLTGILLKNMPGVTTIKFEDILRDQSFVVNGVTVPKPADHINYNGILTQWEKDTAIPVNKISLSTFNANNEYYSNFSPAAYDKFNEPDPTPEEKQEFVNYVNLTLNTSYAVSQVESLINGHFDPETANASEEQKQMYANVYNLIHSTSYTAEQLHPEFNHDGSLKMKSILIFRNKALGTNITAEQLDAVVPSNLFAAYGYDMLSYDAIIS
jgi:hypothetical protein